VEKRLGILVLQSHFSLCWGVCTSSWRIVLHGRKESEEGDQFRKGGAEWFPGGAHDPARMSADPQKGGQVAPLLSSPCAALVGEGLTWAGVVNADVKGEQDAPTPAPLRSPRFPVPLDCGLRHLWSFKRKTGAGAPQSSVADAEDPVTCAGRPARSLPAPREAPSAALLFQTSGW
jgi:hypothetical protein